MPAPVCDDRPERDPRRLVRDADAARGIGALDHRRLADHVRRLLAAGVDGVAPFGTTGEGQSFSVAERRDGVAALIDAGIPADRIVAATGCAALPDTIELTRAGVASGCAGVPGAAARSSSRMSPRTASTPTTRGSSTRSRTHGSRLYLYHIPQVTGGAIPHDVIARLIREFPGVVKGRQGQRRRSRTYAAPARRVFPQLAIFVGHEPHLPAALAAGGAGTICGVANLYPRLVRRLHDGAARGDVAADLARVEAFIATLEGVPLFAAFKALLATLYADPAWAGLRAPLVTLDAKTLRAWLAGNSRHRNRSGARRCDALPPLTRAQRCS